jgi:hypothetical protein
VVFSPAVGFSQRSPLDGHGVGFSIGFPVQRYGPFPLAGRLAECALFLQRDRPALKYPLGFHPPMGIKLSMRVKGFPIADRYLDEFGGD